MGRSQRSTSQIPTINDRFGVSLSLKQCRDLKIDTLETLNWLIDQGWRRFRLMSYWNEHEKVQGKYDFSALDKQIDRIEKAGGTITLCLGVRQPRWPESHWPDWALKLPKPERYKALEDFITATVKRYKGQRAIVSYQLENEALNRSFGEKGDFNRGRLWDEFILVKTLDSTRPLVMSTSNSWGLPFRAPVPDIIGFSLYRVMFQKGRYTRSRLPGWFYKLRAVLTRLLLWRRCFIHELQCEPWGPKAIWEMSLDEQDRSMGLKQIQKNIRISRRTGLYPIDFWGGEWWYWRLKEHGDPSVANEIRQLLAE